MSMGVTYRVLIVVHRLSQNRAERHGRQSTRLLPHGSDLKQGPERWRGEHGLVRLFPTELNRRAAAALTQPADGTVVGLVTQRVCAGVAETQMSAGQDECVSQVWQTHNTLAAVVAVLIIRRLHEERKAAQISHTWRANHCLKQRNVRLYPIPWFLGCFCSRCHKSPVRGSSRGPPTDTDRQLEFISVSSLWRNIAFTHSPTYFRSKRHELVTY